eukprot:TRINITY_DN5549_c0_g1_i2.p1 TRINITY_DN5549_c0_g1~~TRINITY_DN5549_c0_g1_i2.p1  ORF type:complete len:527 (-),score=60.63 TRINITY_DN5549_c0_g1_i2:261-1841(-)
MVMSSRLDPRFMAKNVVFDVRQACGQRVFWFGAQVALPNAILASVLKVYTLDDSEFADLLFTNQSAFSSVAFLIGLFVAFRASQAYSRFWEGVGASFHIVSCLIDAASNLFAASNGTHASKEDRHHFQSLIVRLLSILHALMQADLEVAGELTGYEHAFSFELIDPGCLHPDVFKGLKDSPARVELVCFWLQRIICKNIQSGVLSAPPPIITRSFQEINTAVSKFHDALKLAEVPFPVAYSIATKVALVLHWFCTLFVAQAWCNTVVATFALSFVTVFMLWSLNFIASELENPFGLDANDVDSNSIHRHLNRCLLEIQKFADKPDPILVGQVAATPDDGERSRKLCRKSLSTIWESAFSEGVQGAADSPQHNESSVTQESDSTQQQGHQEVAVDAIEISLSKAPREASRPIDDHCPVCEAPLEALRPSSDDCPRFAADGIGMDGSSAAVAHKALNQDLPDANASSLASAMAASVAAATSSGSATGSESKRSGGGTWKHSRDEYDEYAGDRRGCGDGGVGGGDDGGE